MPVRCQVVFALLPLGGCAAAVEGFDAEWLTPRVQAATGHAIRPDGDDAKVPPGVAVDDGVTRDEAAAIAMWNNPGFHEAIAELGLRRVDLVAAGLLTNPVLSLLFPLGPKQLEFGVNFPIYFAFVPDTEPRAE